MAALANGLLQALDAALSPPTTTTTTTTPTGFLQRAADAAAAFAGTEVARRNERLTEAAVRALLARAREGDGAFTVLTLSLSSTLMAVFRGLKERWSQQKQQEGRRLRVVRRLCLSLCFLTSTFPILPQPNTMKPNVQPRIPTKHHATDRLRVPPAL